MRQRHTIDAWGTKLYFDCEGAQFDSVAAFAEITSYVGLVDDLFSTYKSDSVVSQLREQTIAAQSAKIQGVSGASFTSYGWYKSLVSAVAKAGL